MSLLSDAEIDALVQETKELDLNHLNKTAYKLKGAHKERAFELVGGDGNRFRIIVRISTINAMAFSVILGWINPATGQIFRLRRFDGKSHQHTNKIEKEHFYDFHVHYATERYQKLGLDEDTYARIDNRFADYHQALNCMFDDCGFIYPTASSRDLF